MDGARLWDCQPFYGRPYSEICKGFESVYVSFYKTIRALQGIPAWNARARTLAAALAKEPRLTVSPDPPPTALFHVYLQADQEALTKRRDAVARERSIWVSHGFGRPRVPGILDTEVHVTESMDAISDDDAARAFLDVVRA